jgi:flagellar biogenesis protein FliO
MTLPFALQLQSGAAIAPPLGPTSGPDLGWLLATVAVFVVTIAGLAYLFRRVVGGSLRARASKRDLHVLDVLPLGNKRQLAVVRCYDRTFALGLGERSVDLVAELDSEAIDHDRLGQEEEKDAPFMRRLEEARSRLLGIREIAPQSAASAAPLRGGRRDASAGAADGTHRVLPKETAPSSGATREFIA